MLVGRDVCSPQRAQLKLAATVSRRADAGLAQSLRVGQQLVDALGEPLDVAGRDEHEAVAGGRDLLWPGLAATADRRYAAGHRLDVGDAERLLGGGHREQRAAACLLDRLRRRQLSAKLDALGDLQSCGKPFQGDPLRAVADDHIAQAGMALGEHRQRAHHVGVALACDEMADGHQRGARIAADGCASCGRGEARSAPRWTTRTSSAP